MSSHKVATAAEMRELLALDLLKLEKPGADWDTYSGHPAGRHIRWDGEGYASVVGSSAGKVAAWIQNELHSDNE
tara:strand:+ start:1032 stop:1253 length:222 start_codon:yes stop_codon:yes gene_type:complete